MRVPFPNLSVGEFAVVQAEVATGIVLTTDGQQRHVGSGEMYRIFPSLDSARAFARQVVTPSPKVECWIYDSEQTYIERIVAQS